MTSAPNIAMLAADLRVRTLETARSNASSGATRMSGTAQGSAATGSKLNPDVLAPEAAPDAAAAMPPAVMSRFSERPPVQQSRRPAQPARGRPRRAAPQTPGPRVGARPIHPTLRPQRNRP